MSSTHNSIESSDGDDSTVSSSSTHSLQINSSDDELFDDDLSLGFPPGHITTLTELNELQSKNLNDKLSISSTTDQSTINPSIIPSYFFCPLSNRIMIDPVMIVPTGNTYERRALLRYFIICYPNYHDPISKKPLDIYKDIKDDTLVKGSIDKARKDAWVRYVLNFEEESGENANNVAISDTREIIPDEGEEYSTQIQHSEDSSKESSDNEDIPKSQSPLADDQSQTTSYNKFISYMNSSTDNINNASTTVTTTARTSESNHGWQVPLGVHKVICSKGLTVTTDIHRRSNVVKRKIIRKSLATSDTSTTKEGTKKMKIKRIKKKKQFNVKTTTSIITRDLVLLPGTYVDVLETCIHGGRVRGRISFEEEVLTEVDNELLLAWEEEEVRNQCHLEKKDKSSQSKKKLSKAILSPLHRKASRDGHEKNLPFASELFDSVPVQQMNEGQKNRSSISSTDQSSSSTTIKYNGWITLSWAGNVNDSNEEDKGLFTQPIPLGVYHIFVQGNESTAAVSGSTVKQLPLYEASDSDSNIIDFLVHNQCLEVVETQVMIRKKTEGQDSNNSESEQVVRARCMLPVIKSSLSAEDFAATGKIDSKPQQKFTSGWITLVGQGEDTSAVIPIPLGTYNVTSDEPLLSCDFGSNVKSTHEPGSTFEVVNTRIEFEDDTRTMKCSCGREGKYHTIAVRALIATGGYVTILVSPVGGVQGHDIKLCVCGQSVQSLSYAKPAPV